MVRRGGVGSSVLNNGNEFGMLILVRTLNYKCVWVGYVSTSCTGTSVNHFFLWELSGLKRLICTRTLVLRQSLLKRKTCPSIVSDVSGSPFVTTLELTLVHSTTDSFSSTVRRGSPSKPRIGVRGQSVISVFLWVSRDHFPKRVLSLSTDFSRLPSESKVLEVLPL